MGSHRSSVRREIRSIERGLQTFQREIGDLMAWYEFDAATTTANDTYGEGPIEDPFDMVTHVAEPDVLPGQSGLNFKAPRLVPAIWIRYSAPVNVQSDAGLYTVNIITARFSVNAMRDTGLMSPQDPALHFSDRFSYKGELYRVEEYEPRGWLHGAYLMIDVTGRELKEEELEGDSFPFWQPVGTSTPWTPGQQLDWPAVQPTDWENR